MKFFIPELGTRIRLTKDWTFKLYNEDRNDTLLKAFGLELKAIKKYTNLVRRDEKDFAEITIPAGTELTIDRIYIRKGQQEYSSVTFQMQSCPDKTIETAKWMVKKTKYHNAEPTKLHKNSIKVEKLSRYRGGGFYWVETYESEKKQKPRFWAKLDDVNNIECEVV